MDAARIRWVNKEAREVQNTESDKIFRAREFPYTAGQHTIAVDDPTDKSRVDWVAVSLLFDELENGVGHLFIKRTKKLIPPSYQCQLKQTSSLLYAVQCERMPNGYSELAII